MIAPWFCAADKKMIYMKYFQSDMQKSSKILVFLFENIVAIILSVQTKAKSS